MAIKSIITVVGARPQFIKAAVVSKVIRKNLNEILVHTGQHYDGNMSRDFFEELDIPRPDYHLHIGSASHGAQTGRMLEEIEKILLEANADALMVYGDTNTTLAGALAAVKQNIPVIHVEAGLRSYNRKMPEEINRILTDHISDILFCPTQNAVENLVHEGISSGVYEVGDVMCDAVLHYSSNMKRGDEIYENSLSLPKRWYLATIHRAENTGSDEKLKIVLDALEQLDRHVIFPRHPRIKDMVKRLNDKYMYKNISFIDPVGYLPMLYMLKYAEKVITDSGGLQKEAYILQTPCITIRDQTEWIETLNGKWNVLAKLNTEDIVRKVLDSHIEQGEYGSPFGNGDAAVKLANIIESY